MKKINAPVKPLRLTPKEIARADGDITMVVRPQATGGYLVGAFRLSGMAVFPKVWLVEDKGEISSAIKDENRWLSKLGLGDHYMMWDASRDRAHLKAAAVDFWDAHRNIFAVDSAIDHVLQERTLTGSTATSMRALTDKERAKNALQVPVEAGTRVRFLANLGSVLTYDDVPGDGLEGTVITVRTADGDTTYWQERVMVSWDDGKFRPILAEHLRRAPASEKKASAVRMVKASFEDLSAFFGPVRTSGKKRAHSDLVHKATKDLWSFRQNGDQFIIERLFDEGGKPLKV